MTAKNVLLNLFIFICGGVLVVYLLVTLVGGPIASIRYESYDEETEATIVDVQSKRVRNKRHSHWEYKYTYQYIYENEIFTNTSIYIRPKKVAGEIVIARFSSEHPELSMLLLEKQDATAGTVAVSIVTITIIAIAYFNWRKSKRY